MCSPFQVLHCLLLLTPGVERNRYFEITQLSKGLLCILEQMLISSLSVSFVLEYIFRRYSLSRLSFGGKIPEPVKKLHLRVHSSPKDFESPFQQPRRFKSQSIIDFGEFDTMS